MGRRDFNEPSEVQRWSGKRKAEAVLEVLRRTTDLKEFCERAGLGEADVQKWIDDFMDGGTQALKINAKDRVAHLEREITELQQIIGELTLEVRLLRKRAMTGEEA